MTRQETEQALEEKTQVKFFDRNGQLHTGIVLYVTETSTLILTTKNKEMRVRQVDLWVA